MSLTIQDTANFQVIQNSPDWRTAVSSLLNFWISQDRCFSSGEVAATLRTHRPDLKFRVGGIGEFIRDNFHNQGLASYPDNGNGPNYPYQSLRIAQGLYPDRTQAGTEVYVYGPDSMAISNHEFEVYIPLPGQTLDDAPAVDPMIANTPAPSVAAVVSTRLANSDILAKVWPDGRLCVPRSAFEAAVYISGSALHGGEPVFVKQTDTKVTVLLTDPNDSEYKSYMVTNSGGRIAFPNPTKPYVHGNAYSCKIEKGKITVDLSKTVKLTSKSVTE